MKPPGILKYQLIVAKTSALFRLIRKNNYWRLARLSDLLIQKVLKTIERLDRDTQGTVRDRILQAEQRGIIPSAAILLDIRDVRNTITHDYDGVSFNQIVLFVFLNTPFLLQGVQTAMQYSKKFY